MVSLSALWLPIVLSSVAVFVASSIMHMVLPYHRSDYTALPDEDAVTEAIRRTGVGAGTYMFPHCDPKDLGKEEVQQKFVQGPVGVMMLRPPAPPSLGKPLMQWFVYCVVVSFFSGYLAHATLEAGTHYLGVFRVVGTAAFMAYGVGVISDSIWKGERWSTTFKHVFDGLVYGLVTAGVFGWLWP